MALNLESLVNEVPLVWFLGREFDSDIYISNNTLSVGGDDLADMICQYVECADKYRKYLGVQEKERYLILTDNLNAAKKTSYLFADIINFDYKEINPDNKPIFVANLDENIGIGDVTTLIDYLLVHQW